MNKHGLFGLWSNCVSEMQLLWKFPEHVNTQLPAFHGPTSFLMPTVCLFCRDQLASPKTSLLTIPTVLGMPHPKPAPLEKPGQCQQQKAQLRRKADVCTVDSIETREVSREGSIKCPRHPGIQNPNCCQLVLTKVNKLSSENPITKPWQSPEISHYKNIFNQVKATE